MCNFEQAMKLLPVVHYERCIVEFRAIPHVKDADDSPFSKPRSQWFTSPQAGEVPEPFIASLPQWYGVYFDVAARQAVGGRKQEDVTCSRVLVADFDSIDDPTFVTKRIANAGLPAPTAIVRSGGGFHPYWRLGQPVFDFGLEAISKLS